MCALVRSVGTVDCNTGVEGLALTVGINVRVLTRLVVRIVVEVATHEKHSCRC